MTRALAPSRTIRWLLLYLWSVPLALLLSDLLNWQYDGGIGWWLVAGYTFPVLMLSEPFSGAVDINILAACYLVLVSGATASAFRAYWRSQR